MKRTPKDTAAGLRAVWAKVPGVTYPAAKEELSAYPEEDLINRGYISTGEAAEMMQRTRGHARFKMNQCGAKPIRGLFTRELYWRRSEVEEVLEGMQKVPDVGEQKACELTAEEVIKKIGCSRSTLDRLMRKGRLTPRVVKIQKECGWRTVHFFSADEVEKTTEWRQKCLQIEKRLNDTRNS